jgi:hypothetical protein
MNWNVVSIYQPAYLELIGGVPIYGVVCVRCHGCQQSGNAFDVRKSMTPDELIEFCKDYGWSLSKDGPVCDECR